LPDYWAMAGGLIMKNNNLADIQVGSEEEMELI
jgi:hypothetical protein